MNGLSPNDAGSHFTTAHYDIVMWNYSLLKWDYFGYNLDWSEALEELRVIRDATKSLVRGVYRVVRVESVVTHTDMTVLAERELGV